MMAWETTTIGELLEFKNGLNKGSEFFGKGTPIVNYMDVYKYRGIHAEQLRGRVTLSIEEIRRFDVHKGDVFFTRTSETPEEVGYASVMLDEIDDCVFSGFVLRGRPITDKLDIAYCQYAFMTEDIRKSIMSGCTYTTRALTNGKNLSAIEIALPDKAEQHRIAEVLLDTDALIVALEKLIAKKRAIKQGAMQELLTGKRRLPGFEGEWVEKPIRELADIVSGGTPRTTVAEFWDGTVIWVSPTDITGQSQKYLSTSERKITELGLAQSAAVLLPVGTILLCSRATIGELAITAQPTATNQGFKNLVSSPETDTEWLYYAVQPLKSKMIEQASGSTFLEISKASLGNIEIKTPPLKAEQTAIAEILSDMDTEIDALTAKLNKLRNIKQGMMSELLTGRIRLVEVEPAKATVEVYPVQGAEQIRQVVYDTTPKGHNQQFDDAVMIAGIVDVLYSDRYPLGRKKVQKCLYLLRRYQDESTAAFKKKAAGPYADEVRYKGGEPLAHGAKYVTTTTTGKGTTFARGSEICKALEYIHSWGKQGDIQWVADKLRYKKVDELELLATVDMAICDLTEAGTPVSVSSIKLLIATNTEWKAKLKKQTFSDVNIARAIRELSTLLQGGN